MSLYRMTRKLKRITNEIQEKCGEHNSIERDIGELLVQGQEELGRDKKGFEAWVGEQFPFEPRTAYNLMALYRVAADIPFEVLKRFQKSALYKLGTTVKQDGEYVLKHPKAVQEAVKLAESGEKVTRGMAERLIIRGVDPSVCVRKGRATCKLSCKSPHESESEPKEEPGGGPAEREPSETIETTGGTVVVYLEYGADLEEVLSEALEKVGEEREEVEREGALEACCAG